jgi:hypothetical protein
MRRLSVSIVLAGLLWSTSSFTCEYVPGESLYLDYAICRYGKDAVVAVDLPENSSWDQCVYHVQAFMPPKLLAVTRDKDGKEVCSVNARGDIGNPCYLVKSACDAALKNQQQ